MRVQPEQQEGGFVRKQRRAKGGFSHRRASQNFKPNTFKTWEERQAEQEAARQRWAGESPIVVAREMIAEANLQDETMAELLATVSQMDSGQLNNFVSSGKLAEILEDLAGVNLLTAPRVSNPAFSF